MFLRIVFFLFASSLFGDLKKDLLKISVQTQVESIIGWCSKEKALNFTQLVLEIQPEICVEIGAYAGASIYPVAEALKYLGKGNIYAIDPWNNYESIAYLNPEWEKDHIDFWSQINLVSAYEKFTEMLQDFDLEELVEVLHMCSEEAAYLIPPIDILHIDGCHSEIGSIKDVLLFTPKVKLGGYIWYNDANWYSRQEALKLLLQSCEVIKIIEQGKCILLRKYR